MKENLSKCRKKMKEIVEPSVKGSPALGNPDFVLMLLEKQ